MRTISVFSAILAAALAAGSIGLQLPTGGRFPVFDGEEKIETYTGYDFTVDDSVDNTGETDASRALSVLISEASAVGTPDAPATIYIPAGTYLIEDQSTIFIQSNVKIILDDAAVIKSASLRTANDPMIVQRSDNSIGGYGQIENVEICGGTWDVSQSADRHLLSDESGEIDITVMGFAHGSNIYIHDTVIRNNRGQHVLVFDACRDVTVENVDFSDCYPLEGTDKLSTMETIHFDMATEIGGEALPYDGTPSVNVTVRNCSFRNVVSGVGSHHTDDGLCSVNENYTFTNNTFDGMPGACFNLALVDGARVEGNTSVNCTGSFAIVDSSKNIVICDNDIQGGQFGVYMNYGAYGSDALTIENNRIQNTENVAIYARAFENEKAQAAEKKPKATIKNNQIENSTYYGIFTDYFEAEISDNQVDTVTYGAQLDDMKLENVSLIRVGNTEKVTIQGNSVSDCNKGIGVFTVGQAIVDQNTVKQIEKDAIYVDGSGHTISGNSVDGAERGIYLIYRPSDNLKNTIADNTVLNTGLSGITAFVEDGYVSETVSKKTEVAVTGNTVMNVNNYGIHVRGYNATVENNYVKSVGFNPAEKDFDKKEVAGIRVNNSVTEGTISSNTVIDTIVGIQVFHSKNILLNDNSVKYASRYGIQLGSSDSENFTVDSNTAIESGSKDSDDDSAALRAVDLTNLTVTNNTLYGNGVYDIAVWNVKGETVLDQNAVNGEARTRVVTNVKPVGTNNNAVVAAFSDKPISIKAGEKLLLLSDREDSEAVVSWSSTKPEVASVDQCGVLHAVAAGETDITMERGDTKQISHVTVIDDKKNYDVKVNYTTHVQRIGWQTIVSDGVMAGTSGQSLRLEAIRIKLDTEMDLGIEYTTHVQNYGWLPWVQDGEDSGTSGESKRLEAIEIRLTGADAELYDVYYRVHAQKYGWLGWAKNGEASGTAGFSYRLEGIQIVVQLKTKDAPGKVAGISSWHPFSYVSKKADGTIDELNGKVVYTTGNPKTIKYSTHVQGIGWQAYKFNGQMSGTKNQSRRLEGIKISLCDQKYDGDIEYKTYVQSIGWMDAVTNGEMSGTSGRSLRLEAIQIRLTGEMAENYDIYYRVQSQTYGWMGWAKNGEDAGTVGPGKRLEAIQIVLVKKGGRAPADNWGGYWTSCKDACKYN